MVRFSPNTPLAERAPELRLPDVEVLSGIGVHRLVGPAMRSRIADGVAGCTAAPGSRPGVMELDGLGRRPFVDPGDPGVGVPAARQPAEC